MQHVVISRVAFGLCGLFVVAALLFGWCAGSRPTPVTPPAALDGAALFATHCGGCHEAGGLRVGDGVAREQELAEFLARHGDAPATARGAIIGYLLQRTPPPAP